MTLIGGKRLIVIFPLIQKRTNLGYQLSRKNFGIHLRQISFENLTRSAGSATAKSNKRQYLKKIAEKIASDKNVEPSPRKIEPSFTNF